MTRWSTSAPAVMVDVSDAFSDADMDTLTYTVQVRHGMDYATVSVDGSMVQVHHWPRMAEQGDAVRITRHRGNDAAEMARPPRRTSWSP